MAAPTITVTGSGSNKTTGTTLAVTLTTTTYATGDVVVAGFSCDPATGTVSFASTGTAILGSWTTPQDIAFGSGTSGVRTVVAWALVTSGGSVTSVTITHPSLTARASEIFKVSGADNTQPVLVSNSDTTAVYGGGVIQDGVTLPSGGIAASALLYGGVEVTGGTATTTNTWTGAGWSTVSHDTSSVGTTGSTTDTNISVANTTAAGVTVNSATISGQLVFSGTSASEASAILVFQSSTAPAAPTAVIAVLAGNGIVNIQWSDSDLVAPAQTYTVVRGTDRVNYPTTVASGIGQGTQTLLDTGVKAGTYFYKVIATNSVGSATSNGVMVTVPLSALSSTSGVSAATSSLATSISWTPTAGNVLVLYIGGSSGTTTSRTVSVTGWTKVTESYQNNGLNGGYGSTFIKISAGNENSSPPTITLTGGNLALCYIIEEWSGAAGGGTYTIDTNYFPDQPTPVAANNTYTAAATTTLNSTTVTMATADCLILTLYAGRGSTSQPAPTWGGGAATSTNGASGQSAFCFSGMQEANSYGSGITHTVTMSNGQGLPVEVVGSLVFRLGAVNTSSISWLGM